MPIFTWNVFFSSYRMLPPRYTKTLTVVARDGAAQITAKYEGSEGELDYSIWQLDLFTFIIHHFYLYQLYPSLQLYDSIHNRLIEQSIDLFINLLKDDSWKLFRRGNCWNGGTSGRPVAHLPRKSTWHTVLTNEMIIFLHSLCKVLIDKILTFL